MHGRIMHFLGRQVNVCAFVPIVFTNSILQMQTMRSHAKNNANRNTTKEKTQTNDIFQTFESTTNRKNNNNSSFAYQHHFSFFLNSLDSKRFLPARAKWNFSIVCRAIVWVCAFLCVCVCEWGFQRFCCWWCISSCKWYSYRNCYVYSVTHAHFFFPPFCC